MKAIELRKHTPYLLAVIVQSTSIIRLLKRLVRLAPAHVPNQYMLASAFWRSDGIKINVRALHSWEQRDIAQMIDLLLPLRLRLLGRIDVLGPVLLALFDDIRDPTSLDFNSCWAV
jgi:hypothetical protein